MFSVMYKRNFLHISGGQLASREAHCTRQFMKYPWMNQNHFLIWLPPYPITTGKVQAILVGAWTGPESYRRLRFPFFKTISTWKVVRLSALSTGRLVLIFVTGWVEPRTTAPPERLCHSKIPTTPSGIETATFRLVARWATACPPITVDWFQFAVSLLSSQNRSTRSSSQPDVRISYLSIIVIRKCYLNTIFTGNLW